MITVNIKASKRAGKSDLDTMRQKGQIPAVFYGAGKTSTSITINKIEFKKVWNSAGESSAIKVTTGEEDIDALIHEVQTDPVTDEPIHVDFLAIDMTKKIKVKVPLEYEGVSEAVKSDVGMLVKVLHEIEIEALPKDLPHSIPVDISGLANIKDQINVESLSLPAGVTAITGDLEVVCSIAEQKEVVEEVTEPVDLSAIEVSVEKGKKEEEGEAAPEGEKTPEKPA